MLMKYMCAKCRKYYKYYDGVHRKLDFDINTDKDSKTAYKDGVFVNANSIKLCHHLPSPQADETQEYEEVCGSLKEMIINLCPECMHELLMTCEPLCEGMNCFEI